MFPIPGDNQAVEIFRKTHIKSPNIISLFILLQPELSLCKSTATEVMEIHLHGFPNPRNSWITSLLSKEHNAMGYRLLGLEGPLFCC